SGLCAYHDSTTRDGLVATATIHVVQDNCQVSFVSIMKFWDGNAIYKTATGTFAASDTRVKLSVLLPCDQGSETDVVLGPPTLYPLGDLDLGATAFDVACPAGGGGGGGGGTTSYPDLAATVTAARKSPVRIGDTVPLTVTVKNNGAAGAGGVHVLISLSPNSILRGTATASRGPGCTGVTFLDCNLGSVGAGSVT